LGKEFAFLFSHSTINRYQEKLCLGVEGISSVTGSFLLELGTPGASGGLHPWCFKNPVYQERINNISLKPVMNEEEDRCPKCGFPLPSKSEGLKSCTICHKIAPERFDAVRDIEMQDRVDMDVDLEGEAPKKVDRLKKTAISSFSVVTSLGFMDITVRELE